MTSDKCNGWTDRETWRVQLHLANDERVSAAVTAIAGLYVTRFARCPDETGHYPENFSAWLRDFVLEQTGCWNVGGTTFEMLARDTVESSLARVDWQQLAEHWLEVGRADCVARGQKVVA